MNLLQSLKSHFKRFNLIDKPADLKTLRSNYIFSRIAEHYKAKHETYVKWRMGKAVNGILLTFENGAQLEISSFNAKDEQEVDLFENEKTVHCEDIYFLVVFFMDEFPGIDKFHHDFPRIENFISKANSEFNKLDKSIDPYSIRKLQLSINIEAMGDANLLKNDICSSISKLVNTDRYKSTEARF
ncbi:MAG TPA: hypothetical protein VF691_00340 [Cytophagaceae bacterium]|jgi:hypothetical protein